MRSGRHHMAGWPLSRRLRRAHRVRLQDFVTVVVDDLHGYRPCSWRIEGPAAGAVERFPGVQVDIGSEGGAQALVWIVATGEIGVAHKEALTVVVSVDEPTRDRISGVRPDLAR